MKVIGHPGYDDDSQYPDDDPAPDWNPEWDKRPSTDDAHPDVVLAEVCWCASHWEKNARLLGNVRAGDIQRAIAVVLAELDRLRAVIAGHEQRLSLIHWWSESASKPDAVKPFVERCRELRDGSPNAFYQHVDAFCKAATGEPVGSAAVDPVLQIGTEGTTRVVDSSSSNDVAIRGPRAVNALCEERP